MEVNIFQAKFYNSTINIIINNHNVFINDAFSILIFSEAIKVNSSHIESPLKNFGLKVKAYYDMNL